MEVRLTILDYAIVAGYIVFAMTVGVLLARRAAQSVAQYFAAGKELPWWVAGTSMVATTFASDTPLAVTGIVRTQGVSGNWFWWSGALANMLGTFFFAPLWRRSEALTDLEFISLRYHGLPAKILRIFRTIYSSLIANSIVMGWVIAAMVKIVQTTFGWEPKTALAVLVSVAFLYTVFAGLWGVVLTDFVQFALAMMGAIWLAFASLKAIGGSANLVHRLNELNLTKLLAFTPSPSDRELWAAFLTYILIQWWAVGRPDGEGYIAQRVLASKDERNAALSFLWFSFAHYVLRPWWWIVVALASLLVMPQTLKLLGDEGAYPAMMVQLLPAGALGIMVAAMLAAFMSTMDTHMNWAASYLVIDLYRPFIKPNADERHYVLVGRIATALTLALGVATALVTERVEAAWKLLAGLNAGIGLVSILRWLWWRVNAWSEISAMATALIVNSAIYAFAWLGNPTATYLTTNEGFPFRLLTITVCVQLAWVLVTFLTEPEPMEKLVSFYRKVRPHGWWSPVAKVAGMKVNPLNWRWFFGWVGGVALIYGGLVAMGGLLLSQLQWLLGGGIAAALGLIGVRLGLKALFESKSA
ncbi:MAG: sodium:solute symporter family protein [Candidatus Fervidibacter sp.]|uniref:sodium:solute symporter family protein n=1 Tax=Candidatus Fervidibacter sp. TaxID=3100871 RepID=UPI00404B06A0